MQYQMRDHQRWWSLIWYCISCWLIFLWSFVTCLASALSAALWAWRAGVCAVSRCCQQTLPAVIYEESVGDWAWQMGSCRHCHIVRPTAAVPVRSPGRNSVSTYLFVTTCRGAVGLCHSATINSHGWMGITRPVLLLMSWPMNQFRCRWWKDPVVFFVTEEKQKETI